MAHQDWSLFDETGDVDTMWNVFENNINRALDLSCPIRTIVLSDSKPEWFNNEVIQLMRKRDKAYSKARRTKNDVNWRNATFLRNRVDMFIKQFKKQKILNSLERYKNDPNRFWKEIRSVVPKGQQAEVNSLCDEEDDNTYEGTALHNHINHYFSHIGTNLADAILRKQGNQVLNTIAPLVLNKDSDAVCNILFTPEDLQRSLKLIDRNKSSAITNIRSQTICDAFNHIPDKILRIYNVSIQTAVFPDAWKTSIVVPLPKVSNQKYAYEMQPISLILLPGKIFEHLISYRLKQYLYHNNVLLVAQHGFRKAHSTITSIATLLHKIYENANIKKDSYLVYFDLKKAFDTCLSLHPYK